MESTLVSEAEVQRRESYIRANQRVYEWHDPFTWGYSARSALTGTIICLSAITYHNIMKKRPWHYSLVPRMGIMMIFTGAGYMMGKLREHNFRTRDAVVLHYMSLHPTDFELLNNRYGRPFSGILLPWFPKRPQYGDYSVKEEKEKI